MRIKVSLSANPILYRIVTLEMLLHTLRNNKFLLTAAVMPVEKQLVKKWYFLSLSRTKFNSYTKGRNFAALLTLNGTKLSHKFSITPIDYWGEDFRQHRKGDYEQEDRLGSDKPYIDDAARYILDITLVVSLPNEQKEVNEVIELCKERNIQLTLYSNAKDALLGHKRKAIPVERIKQGTREWFDNFREGDSDLLPYIELIKETDYHKLSQGAKTIAYDITRDFDRIQEKLLHCLKSATTEDPRNREDLHTFIAGLKKKRLTVKTYLQHLLEYWKPLFNQR